MIFWWKLLHKLIFQPEGEMLLKNIIGVCRSAHAFQLPRQFVK